MKLYFNSLRWRKHQRYVDLSITHIVNKIACCSALCSNHSLLTHSISLHFVLSTDYSFLLAKLRGTAAMKLVWKVWQKDKEILFWNVEPGMSSLHTAMKHPIYLIVWISSVTNVSFPNLPFHADMTIFKQNEFFKRFTFTLVLFQFESILCV